MAPVSALPATPPLAAGVDPSPPTAVVGVVGGGQLARMKQQAAIALGVQLVVLSETADDPACRAGATHLPGRHDDLDRLFELAERCDVVTFDHELVPNEHIAALVAAGHVVRPGPGALGLAQDKTLGRRVLADAGYPTPPFIKVTAGDVEAVARFADAHEWPVVIKAPQGGYDGRGVQVAHSVDELPSDDWSANGHWLVEEHVAIERELAVVLARRPSGGTAVYPVVETIQEDGICVELLMPARVPSPVAKRAAEMAVGIGNEIDAVGIMAVELFLTSDGELLVNELALRPHNSGHATIDACETSQFENHLRAVMDWPLGSTAQRAPAAMVNLLGGEAPFDSARLPAALEIDPAIRVHLYAKTPRPGRKIGHLTALASTTHAARRSARRAASALLEP